MLRAPVRRRAARLALVLAGALTAAAACELLLRLFSCRLLPRDEYQSRPFLAENRYWGIWHYPNDVVEHRESCFDAHYRTNELGMKQTAPMREGVKRIALLGDSFVEGFGNDNESSLDALLDPLVGDGWDVLNFGVSGGFSTIDELVLYDDFARSFHPRIAILFFLNSNDLQDNLDPAKRRFIDDGLDLVYPRASPEEVSAYVRSRAIGPAETTTVAGSCLGHAYRLVEKAVRLRTQMLLNFRWDFRDELARVYLPDEDDDVRRAWSITEASLRRLDQIARADGTKLVVVDIADPYQIDPNWLRVSSARMRRRLDATKPDRRLAEICGRLGIAFYDMYPDARRYIEENRLRFPYLSFTCNRHYSALGQRLMATLVARYLEASGLLD